MIYKEHRCYDENGQVHSFHYGENVLMSMLNMDSAFFTGECPSASLHITVEA